MIIDDEYCQYEMWRIVNKAETDAIKKFAEEMSEAESAADPAKQKEALLAKWSEKAAFEKAHEESTEESVYNVNFSGKMQSLWESVTGSKD